MRGYKEDLQFQWLLRIPFLTYWHQIILENEFKNYTFDKFWIGYCWERRGKRKAFLSHLNFSLYLYSLIVSISHGQRKNTYISFSAHSHSPPPLPLVSSRTLHLSPRCLRHFRDASVIRSPWCKLKRNPTLLVPFRSTVLHCYFGWFQTFASSKRKCIWDFRLSPQLSAASAYQ